MKKLKERLANLKELAKKDLSEWNPNSRTSMEGAKRAAKEEIPVIEQAIYEETLNNVRILIATKEVSITGQIVEALRNLGPEAALVDALALEKKFFGDIFGSQRPPYRFDSNTIFIMNNLLYKLAEDINALSIPKISGQASDFGSMETASKAVEKMSSIFNRTFGTDLKNIYTAKLIREKITANTDSDVKIVFIGNANEEDLEMFKSLGKQVAIITETAKIGTKVSKDTDANEVIEALMNFKEEAKKQNKKTNKK
ncbi:MAG TPA: hypothetical protein PKI14_01675 [Fervidobacterium sp.]|nr:hypothetical protein [Fervidobacterium sp.]